MEVTNASSATIQFGYFNQVFRKNKMLVSKGYSYNAINVTTRPFKTQGNVWTKIRSKYNKDLILCEQCNNTIWTLISSFTKTRCKYKKCIDMMQLT